MRTISRKLNMAPGGIPVVIKLNQYDEDFALIFTLYSSDNTFVLESGTTAAIRGTKKSGTGYSQDVIIDTANATVTVAGDQQITASAGYNTFEIVLYNGGKQLNSANFGIYVEPAAMDADTIADKSVLRELGHFDEQIETAEEAAEAAERSRIAAEAAKNAAEAAMENVVYGSEVTNIVKLSGADYATLTDKDSNTLYVVGG